jgi:PKD repeat protein
VSFNGAASSDPDGDALTYAWRFGDGSTGSGATPTHTYATFSTTPLTVRLIVTDPFGAKDTATTTATIHDVAPRIVSLDANPDTILVGESVRVSGRFEDPGANIWMATIDWVDGYSDFQLAPSKTFSFTHPYFQNMVGRFYVLARVVDNGQLYGVRQVVVTVLTPPQWLENDKEFFQTLVYWGWMSSQEAKVIIGLEERAIAAANRVSHFPHTAVASAMLGVTAQQEESAAVVAAVNQLNAAINYVEALVRSRRLSADRGQVLIDRFHRVILAMGTP